MKSEGDWQVRSIPPAPVFPRHFSLKPRAPLGFSDSGESGRSDRPAHPRTADHSAPSGKRHSTFRSAPERAEENGKFHDPLPETLFQRGPECADCPIQDRIPDTGTQTDSPFPAGRKVREPSFPDPLWKDGLSEVLGKQAESTVRQFRHRSRGSRPPMHHAPAASSNLSGQTPGKRAPDSAKQTSFSLRNPTAEMRQAHTPSGCHTLRTAGNSGAPSSNSVPRRTL